MIELLNTIPDVCEQAQLDRWLDHQLIAIRRFTATEHARASAELLQIDGATIAGACAPSPFGKYASSSFRRFAAALFCADLACYETAADRVNFERLLFVLQSACAGFRLFALRDGAGALLPVGYTGVYPVDEATFTRLECGDASLADRLIVPLAAPLMHQHFCYLFNYSIIGPLRKSECSRRLLGALAEDLRQASPRGMATITVSNDGRRVAERFGMRQTATLHFAGLSEAVLTVRALT
jgi:hypothetical protein